MSTLDTDDIITHFKTALHRAVTLTFDSEHEARGWVQRINNYRNRHAQHFKSVLVMRKGAIVTMKLPSARVEVELKPNHGGPR